MKELGSESPMESLFDIRSLEAITGGEPAALQRLLETLLASSRDDRTRLAELLELADLQGVAELAHRIKGLRGWWAAAYWSSLVPALKRLARTHRSLPSG